MYTFYISIMTIASWYTTDIQNTWNLLWVFLIWTKRKANSQTTIFQAYIFFFFHFLFSETIFYNPPTHPYLQFMQIEKNVRFNWLPLMEIYLWNIPILPEAFLTFASKSFFGPSYASNQNHTPCFEVQWTNCFQTVS